MRPLKGRVFPSLLVAALLSLSAVVLVLHNTDSRFARWAEIVSRLEYERRETQRQSYHDESRYNMQLESDLFFRPFQGTDAFAVVETYTNQLSASLLGFLQLSQILDTLNLSVAEPFVLRSKLRGIPPTHLGVNGTPSLSWYFNRSAFQALLHDCSVLHHHGRKFYKYREFLVRSSRSLVVVHLSMNRLSGNPRMGRKAGVCSNSYDDTAMNLQRKLNSHLAAVVADEEASEGRTYANFSVITSFCLDYNPKLPISLKQQLKNVIKLASDKCEESTHSVIENTVSFVLTGNWGLMRNFPSLYSIFDPSVTLQYHNCNITQVPHTESVASYARAFLNSLNASRPLVAVHLRFEQIFKSAFVIYRNSPTYISDCVKRVHQVLEKLVSSLHRTDGSIMNGIIVHDLSTYGSNHKTHTIKKHSQVFMYIFKSFGFREVSFDPGSPQFSGASTEQTFVSLVEQEALTMVDRLVLIGGGRFQTHIKERFLREHPRENITELCARNLTQSQFYIGH